MAKAVNLKQAEALIECETDFRSNTGSLQGYNVVIDGIREYIVFSYAQQIAKVTYCIDYDDNQDVVTTRNVWITPQKFSVTTSRHTNIARRALRVI